MQKSVLTWAILTCIGYQAYAQSLSVNTTGAAADASAMVDISSAAKGLLIPRVALTAINTAGPITTPLTSLMIYNTATASTGTANAVTPGYYYWNGTNWIRVTDNGWRVGASTAGTNAIGAAASIGYFGTNTNSHVDLVTNNLVRGRLTNLGEFFIGTTNTALGGDLMAAVGNATFPWATNGYSNQDGSGIYGQVTGGSTIFAGVQGEYNGTNAQGAGVRGISLNTTAGTAFTTPHTAVSGLATTAGTYKFGVYGSGGVLTTRSGAVLGNDAGVALGALGYYSFSGLDYSVYGFGQAHTTGGGTGFTGNEQKLDTNTQIGLGIYGGVMGGWVRGLKYGFNTRGETYSLYIDGKGYTNEPLAYLMPTETGERVASYMVTSMQPEVCIRGKANLQEGKVFVAFEKKFSSVISRKADDMMITVTPQGKTNGVYVDDIGVNGFWIRENNDGRSNTPIVWMATSIVNTKRPEIAPELLDKSFDAKMNGVMFNDNNTRDKPQYMWWDGTRMRWDAPPPKIISNEHLKYARPQ